MVQPGFVLATMRPRGRMTANLGDETHIEAKRVQKPVNARCAVIREHSVEVGSLGSTSHGVLREGLRATNGAQRSVRLCQRTGDPTDRPRAVTIAKKGTAMGRKLMVPRASPTLGAVGSWSPPAPSAFPPDIQVDARTAARPSIHAEASHLLCCCASPCV